MKKYIFLVMMIVCLSFTTTYATNASHNIFNHVIEQDDVLNHQVTITTQNLGLSQSIDNQEILHQTIQFDNHTTAALQLTHIIFNNLDSKKINNDQIMVAFGDEQHEYPISQYLITSSEAYQTLQQYIYQQHFQSQETLNIDFYLHTTPDVTSEISLSAFDIQFQFESIMIQGSIFNDVNRSGIKDEKALPLPQLKVNLRQNNNLIETTQTDKNGYYQFLNHEMLSTYQLEIENPTGYTMINNTLNNSFTVQSQQLLSPVFTNQEATLDCSIGLVALKYKVHYYIDDKEVLMGTYAYLEKVTVPYHPLLKRDHYIFKGWNTAKDGTGKNYQINEQLEMPTHDLNFYPVWEQNQKDVFLSKQKKSPSRLQASQLQVETSDGTHITIFVLLLLISLGSFIVMKSLKKK